MKRAALCLLLLLLTACANKRRITVASKNFVEQVILGEIVAQHLQHRLGERVDRKLNLGGTLLAHKALVNGGIDIYPEYTGTALTAILKQPPSSDAAAVLATVRAAYRQWNLEWLDPLGFNNTYAMAVAGTASREHHVRTLSDAVRYEPGWMLGVGYEFLKRPDGLPGLLETYPLHLRKSPVSMDLGLLYQALGQGKVDMVAGNSTDGQLSVMDAVVLEDDKHFFPPYQAVVVVRKDALDRNPKVRAALAELSGKFTDEAMRKLNYAVVGKHQPARKVAEKFLRDAGLAQ